MIRNKNLNYIDLGKKSFLLGIFFLPTALPIAAIFLNQPNAIILLMLLVGVVFFRHKQNIVRIIEGVEPKIGDTY